jgi:hypothetical protein
MKFEIMALFIHIICYIHVCANITETRKSNTKSENQALIWLKIRYKKSLRDRTLWCPDLEISELILIFHIFHVSIAIIFTRAINHNKRKELLE